MVALSGGSAQSLSAPLKKHQKYALGFKADYYQTGLFVNGQVDRYIIRGSSQWWEGYRLGLFGRRDLGRYYLQSELAYTGHDHHIQMINLQPNQLGTYDWQRDWYVRGLGLTLRKVETSLLVGRYLTKKIRFQAGPVLSYNIPFRHFWDGYLYLRQFPELEAPNIEIVYDYYRTFRPWLLSGRVGIGVDVWRFTFDVGYQANLSALTDPIQHNGQRYSLPQSTQQLMLSVGFKLFKF